MFFHAALLESGAAFSHTLNLKNMTRKDAEAERDALWAIEYARAVQAGLPEKAAKKIADAKVAGWATRLILAVLKKHFPT